MLVFIGGPEIILIVLVIVLFLSQKDPEFAKLLSRAMNEIKDASNEIKKKKIKNLDLLEYTLIKIDLNYLK